MLTEQNKSMIDFHLSLTAYPEEIAVKNPEKRKEIEKYVIEQFKIKYSEIEKDAELLHDIITNKIEKNKKLLEDCNTISKRILKAFKCIVVGFEYGLISFDKTEEDLSFLEIVNDLTEEELSSNLLYKYKAIEFMCTKSDKESVTIKNKRLQGQIIISFTINIKGLKIGYNYLESGEAETYIKLESFFGHQSDVGFKIIPVRNAHMFRVFKLKNGKNYIDSDLVLEIEMKNDNCYETEIKEKGIVKIIKFYKNGNYFAESIASKRNQTIISIIKENFEKDELEAVVSEHNMYRMKDLENLSRLINAKAIEEGLKEDCLIYSFNDLDKNEIIEIFELQYGT
tara:strand:+ start:11877 stop:12896 length:1020 start_codon:yes stop_codon:yes gene_type:complete